ncbi:MAG: NAD(P) transhydrogenase subunit alpha [Phycisphaerae bacterium]|nr:NAD(P) transhydrogenase subunit alpha [Phycisphaerae bacterium]GIK10753.1 MAG: NAD(P) transhydrogenase subunit alpha part 1 [Chloroflexota bacterium]
MIIGIPKEILPEERRVAALPETVKKFVELGFEVLVETHAGRGVFRADDEYVAAGARIAPDAASLFQRADVVLKVKQPHFNQNAGRHEAEMLREGSILITFLHPAAPANHDIIRTLRDRNITALTMDGIPRTSRAQTMDALTSMSTVTGYKAVLIAASHFPRFIPMIGTAIGAVQPAEILVVGAGVVGLQAIATAKRLGASVKAIDIRADARREAGSLKGTKVVGFEVPEELAVGDGGYARALPDEWLERERTLLRAIAPQMDIIILSALVPGEIAPVLLTDETVRRMRPGSVIVDVSIDQGGNCALTEAGREIVAHDVHVCGTANIPGSVAVDATWLYAHNMLHYVENLFRDGPGTFNADDEIVQRSLVTRDHRIIHTGALKAMGTT